MHVKKFYLFSVLFFFGLATAVNGQTTYLPLHSVEYHLLDRLETFSGTLAPFSTALKPISRKDAVHFLQTQNQAAYTQQIKLSRIDAYNVRRALSISGEWSETADGLDGTLRSKKPILKYFYQTRPDMIHVHTDNFFLVVNPILYTELIKENNQDDIGYINTRGLELRGRISNRIGFYTMLADNQERPVSYVQALEARRAAFPGMGYYRKVKNGNYDLFLARGYFDINLLRDHLNVTFGYDKNFIGDGIRSLVLSGSSAPATFLRLRAHWGRFSYETIFLQLTADYQKTGDEILPHKYATIHQLNMMATPWLRVGIFESTIFSRINEFSLGNFVPVIFYQTAARALGADQKTSLGFNFKAIALHHLQFYGQAFFDQLKFNQLGNGWWGNQFGFQVGGKYFDAFTIRNLDLQGEINMIRPFTYSSDNGITNYTHYNQPLAHPDGAGFAEVIGVARYQPIPRLYLTAKGIYSLQGTDNNLAGNGTNLFVSNDLRTKQDGYGWAPGKQITGFYFNFNAAFELRPRLFIEAGATHLQRAYRDGGSLPTSTSFYGGLRWNIPRREYDFY